MRPRRKKWQKHLGSYKIPHFLHLPSVSPPLHSLLSFQIDALQSFFLQHCCCALHILNATAVSMCASCDLPVLHLGPSHSHTGLSSSPSNDLRPFYITFAPSSYNHLLTSQALELHADPLLANIKTLITSSTWLFYVTAVRRLCSSMLLRTQHHSSYIHYICLQVCKGNMELCTERASFLWRLCLTGLLFVLLPCSCSRAVTVTPQDARPL